MKKRIITLIMAILVACLSLNLVACNNVSGNSESQTIKIKVTSVELSATTIDASIGQTYTLTATVLPQNATDKSLTWTSSNEDVATVEDGEIHCVDVGEVTITAKSKNDVIATCVVRVTKEYKFTKMFIDTQGLKDIVSKDDYVMCSVSVTGDNEDYNFECLSGKIKGRGNSTWEMPKKPYKLKFDSKIDLFGNGSSKTWTLIANYCDPSLIRNHLAYSLADNFDTLESTTKIHTVDLYLNNKYNGVYLVCEQNETGKTRVNIDESLDSVDTGYLLEIDQRMLEEGVEGRDYFNVNWSYAIKAPDVEDEEFTQEHFDFIKNYTTNAYLSFDSASFDYVCEFLDIETFVDAFIIHELFAMVDVGFSSFYLHKDAGGKLKAGPIWDLDISSGNCDYQPDAVRTDYLWCVTNPWYAKLLEFNEFRLLVKQRLQSFDYQAFIDNEINEILKYEQAYNANFEVWSEILGAYVWPNTPEIVAITTWRGQVEYLQQWLTKKLNYMTDVFVNN